MSQPVAAGVARRVLSALIVMVVPVAMLLASLPAAAASSDVQAGRQRVEDFLHGLDGLQAQFKQIVADRNGQSKDEASGTLSIRRPDRFRWDYREPYQQVIVADGTRIWMYDSDLDQVTVRKLDDTLSATPAMLLSGKGNLEDNFTVTQVQQDGSPPVTWVRMEPKRDDTDFKWVRLGFVNSDLKFMELADKLGQTTHLEFSNLERNPPLDPSRFTFTVPPGADVIGDASASAPQGKP
jgi:outer membrane lipoprotein carrier protein